MSSHDRARNDHHLEITRKDFDAGTISARFAAMSTLSRLVLSTIVAALPLSAATIVTPADLDFDAATGTATVGGFLINVSANVGLSQPGSINGTATSLGVNSEGAGDDTDELDTDLGSESLTFSFGQDIIFQSITLASVGVNDALDFSFNGGAPIRIATSGVQTFNETLVAGQTLVITSVEPNPGTANNGVQITQFMIVPEPSSSLLALGGLLLVSRRKR